MLEKEKHVYTIILHDISWMLWAFTHLMHFQVDLELISMDLIPKKDMFL